MKYPLLLIIAVLAISCQEKTANDVLEMAVKAHGGPRYATADYEFTFRNKKLRFTNDGDRYRYVAEYAKGDTTYVDVLENGNFTRALNGNPTALSEKEYAAGLEGVNSIVYFATLPHKLLDPAVNLELGEEVIINGKSYYSLQVNFDEEGGGTDHDDNFRYWINQETNRIDYLAYDYRTNGGGVRFRSAYNPRVVEGILFQDYVNYGAEIGTPLDSLPALYEAGKLKEFSKIETERVVALKN